MQKDKGKWAEEKEDKNKIRKEKKRRKNKKKSKKKRRERRVELRVGKRKNEWNITKDLKNKDINRWETKKLYDRWEICLLIEKRRKAGNGKEVTVITLSYLRLPSFRILRLSPGQADSTCFVTVDVILQFSKIERNRNKNK